MYHYAVTNAPQWPAGYCQPEGFMRRFAQYTMRSAPGGPFWAAPPARLAADRITPMIPAIAPLCVICVMVLGRVSLGEGGSPGETFRRAS